MAQFYSRSSQTSTVYPEAVKSFSSLLDFLQGSGKQAINILEVGAGTLISRLLRLTLTVRLGTGLLTKYLVQVLQQKPELLAEYTVTDASYVRNSFPFKPQRLSSGAFRVGLGGRARSDYPVQQTHSQNL
jgi:hypothetical protein